MCAVFPFHKHPTAVRANLDSGFPHRVICELETDIGCMPPSLIDHSISEDEVLISLYQRAFLWVLFVPLSRWAISRQVSQATWAKFSFTSGSPDVSLAIKCGVNLVCQHNMEELARTIVQLWTSYDDYSHVIRNSCKEPTVYRRLHIYDDEARGTGSSYEEDPHPQRQSFPPAMEETSAGTQQHSYEVPPSPNNSLSTGPLDFHPWFYYDFCFPPSKVTQEWFSHRSHGHSVTIDIPPNLYNDNNWMGLALYASFSINGDRETVLENVNSKIRQFLYVQLVANVAGVDDIFIKGCQTSTLEIVWLNNIGEFIWISYVPGEFICK
ncbi:uncharacterized protein LOC132183998 [Corylus avellana]|uniref:uncharacterized protein LOC132183998 n=1 Tax=Corylus avellana TaxID=13451 RepID=UPI00286B3AAD|nr:uncharacterized protein LOC132183998 [Corylus avellana]